MLVPVLAITSVAFLLLIHILVPTVIIPCFFSYDELPDGDLKDLINAEARKYDIPVQQINVIDGSKRSSHSNAFVSGMSSFRKVVLFDTLIEQHPNDEILAVISHEFGHVHHNHLLKGFLFSVLSLVIMFSLFAFTLGNKSILESFGFNHTSNFLYLFIFTKLFMPVDFATKFLSNWIIRTNEY